MSIVIYNKFLTQALCLSLSDSVGNRALNTQLFMTIYVRYTAGSTGNYPTDLYVNKKYLYA